MKAQEIVDRVTGHAKQLKVNESLAQANIPTIHARWPIEYKKATMSLDELRKR